jgi:hypothetical protein
MHLRILSARCFGRSGQIGAEPLRNEKPPTKWTVGIGTRANPACRSNNRYR